MAKKKSVGKKVRKVRLSGKELEDLIEGMPIRHQSLSQETLAVCRYTFSRVGKYVVPNLEKWELGFMRDTNPNRELGFWVRVCIMLDLVQPKDPKQFVASISRASFDGNMPPEVKTVWEQITYDDLKTALDNAFREAGFTGDW